MRSRRSPTTSSPRLRRLESFKDADLIGFPVRVVVGAKGLANGGVEIKRRCDDKSKMQIVAPDAALEAIKALLGDPAVRT